MTRSGEFLRSTLRLAIGSLLLVGMGVAASADDELDAIISRARANIGPETTLNQVESLHYKGRLFSDDGTTGMVEIIFRKPQFQMVVVEIENIRETTALSGYDGWRKLEDLGNEDDWELTLLEAPQIRRLQANAWENLNWFRGIGNRKVKVVYEGRETIDGVDCDRVAYIHSEVIVFTRYFDVSTGRLVVTVTESGGQIREEGEIVVAGIRFPERVVTSIGGKSSRIEFDVVEVNIEYDEALFDVPMLLPSKGS